MLSSAGSPLVRAAHTAPMPCSGFERTVPRHAAIRTCAGFGGPGQLAVQRRRGCVLAISEQLVGAGQTGGGDLRSQTALRAGERLLQSFGRSIPTDPAQGVGRRAGQGSRRRPASSAISGSIGRAITARSQRADHAELELAIQRSQGVPQHLINGRAGNAFERAQRGVRRKLLVGEQAVHAPRPASPWRCRRVVRRQRPWLRASRPAKPAAPPSDPPDAAKSLGVVSGQAVGIQDQLLKRVQRLPLVAVPVTRDGARTSRSGRCRRPSWRLVSKARWPEAEA